MVEVSWADAKAFCDWLTRKEGKKYGLPTEAQWEYACRAGTQTKYSFGDDENDLGDHAWFLINSDSRAHVVGQKRPNAWGLSDMHGNVWQWCEDWFDGGYYANSPPQDPRGPIEAKPGSYRVLRGGGWDSPAGFCRSAFRNWSAPVFRYDFLGFRVSRVLVDK